jgi:hypothetical protein
MPRTRGLPIVATLIASLYLFITTQVIIGCAASKGLFQWLPAVIFTMPTSLAALHIFPHSDTEVGFFVYAVVNACLLFVVCDTIIHTITQLCIGIWTSRRPANE